MRYKTHLIVTYATSLPLLVSSDSLGVGNVVALGIGAIFPDIDHPNSFIGRRMPITSGGMRKAFGHRGMVHSLVGAIVFTAIIRFLLISFNFPLEWGFWFLIGFLAHLIEDSFSKFGIAWLQPIYDKNIQFGFKQIYYITGGVSERIIFIVASALLIYQLVHIGLFSDAASPFAQIKQVMDQIKQTYFV